MTLLRVMLFISSALLLMPLHADDNFYGTIESLPEGAIESLLEGEGKVGTWVIGGRQVAVTEGTQLVEDDGPLAVGACAEVKYEGNFVKEIESEEKDKCGK